MPERGWGQIEVKMKLCGRIKYIYTPSSTLVTKSILCFQRGKQQNPQQDFYCEVLIGSAKQCKL